MSGIQARLAATRCSPAMMASFVVLLHIPRVIAAPGLALEWIMLAVSSVAHRGRVARQEVRDLS